MFEILYTKRYIVECKFDTFYMQSVNSSILEKERGLVVVTQASLFFYFFFLLPIVSFFPVALDYLETILPKIPDLFHFCRLYA